MGQSGRVIVHDFAERLEWSQSLSDEAAWVHFYRRIWPDAVAIVRADAHSQWQAWGVDRWIVLPNGRQILVDEKKRATTYDDVLLEEVSQHYGTGHPRNKVGWAMDPNKRVDFIAYALPSRARCYLMPFELLRVTYATNRGLWHREAQWYPKVSMNKGYQTINCAVPWSVLKAAMCEQMHRKYGEELVLPAPTIDGQQMLFEWRAPSATAPGAAVERDPA